MLIKWKLTIFWCTLVKSYLNTVSKCLGPWSNCSIWQFDTVWSVNSMVNVCLGTRRHSLSAFKDRYGFCCIRKIPKRDVWYAEIISNEKFSLATLILFLVAVTDIVAPTYDLALMRTLHVSILIYCNLRLKLWISVCCKFFIESIPKTCECRSFGPASCLGHFKLFSFSHLCVIIARSKSHLSLWNSFR